MGCCVGSKGDKNSEPLKPNGVENKRGHDEHPVSSYPQEARQPEAETNDLKKKELDESNFGIFQLPQQSVVEVKGVNVYVPEGSERDVVHDEDVLSFRNEVLPANFAITVG